MGITIPTKRLELALEEAVAVAESDANLPAEWLRRVERIGDCPSKTYVAALGTALLARASDDRVDVMTVKKAAGPTAYSMRGVVRTLAGRAKLYGYHLGVTKREPLNNQPWYGGSRIDRFTTVREDAKPFHRDLVRWLTELNHATSDEAKRALAAFIRLRQRYQRDIDESADTLTPGSGASFEELIELLELFLNEDAEGGKRGQAFAAAVLDLAHDEITLASINDPRHLDVAVSAGGKLAIAVEVKQKPVDEAVAIRLAEETSTMGADKAMLVAIAKNQEPLDAEVVQRTSYEQFGVLVCIYEEVRAFLAAIALQSALTLNDIASELPRLYLARMQEHEVSESGQQYWVDLCGGL